MASEDEFSVAADFTLYSNPLVRALHRPASENKAKEPQKKPEKIDEVQPKEDEWIASDMTAYDSPMSHLDKRTVMRENKEFDDIEKISTIHSKDRKASNGTNDGSLESSGRGSISINTSTSSELMAVSESGPASHRIQPQNISTGLATSHNSKGGIPFKGVKTSVMANPSTGVKINIPASGKTHGAKENKMSSLKDNRKVMGTQPSSEAKALPNTNNIVTKFEQKDVEINQK